LSARFTSHKWLGYFHAAHGLAVDSAFETETLRHLRFPTDPTRYMPIFLNCNLKIFLFAFLPLDGTRRADRLW